MASEQSLLVAVGVPLGTAVLGAAIALAGVVLSDWLAAKREKKARAARAAHEDLLDLSQRVSGLLAAGRSLIEARRRVSAQDLQRAINNLGKPDLRIEDIKPPSDVGSERAVLLTAQYQVQLHPSATSTLRKAAVQYATSLVDWARGQAQEDEVTQAEARLFGEARLLIEQLDTARQT